MSHKYEPQKCTECGCTLTYTSRLNRGMSDIVKSIAVAIGNKGINAIHPMKEMLCDPREVPASDRIKNGLLTPRQLTVTKSELDNIVKAWEEMKKDNK